jgi:predicted  nucleic acid-binding Zn-ribbon protein
MACMTHLCIRCDNEWMNNKNSGICPKCGSWQVNSQFDEEGDDDPRWDDEEEEEEDEDAE